MISLHALTELAIATIGCLCAWMRATGGFQQCTDAALTMTVEGSKVERGEAPLAMVAPALAGMDMLLGVGIGSAVKSPLLWTSTNMDRSSNVAIPRTALQVSRSVMSVAGLAVCKCSIGALHCSGLERPTCHCLLCTIFELECICITVQHARAP